MLDVVDAAYRLERSSDEWLGELVAAALPAFGDALGAFGFTYELTPAGTVRVTSEVVTAGHHASGHGALIASTTQQMSPEQVAWSSEHVLMTASEAHARHGVSLGDVEAFETSLRLIGDSIAAKRIDSTGEGCVVGGMLARARATSPAERERWACVLSHVLAGMRLRSALLEGDGDAVLDARGRVVHAEAEARSRTARDALREAAACIDRARTAGDPDAALRARRALVSGRWSLLDRFDRDGRRFLVARRNDPAVARPAQLSARERQVLAYAALGYTNKHIAYTLGLRPSTVSTHLHRAMRKVGARSHGALLDIWREARHLDLR